MKEKKSLYPTLVSISNTFKILEPQMILLDTYWISDKNRKPIKSIKHIVTAHHYWRQIKH